mmetsp:Transcript_17742/g.26437  ORF Transcript_17742/g.26437 Transcript_17742/m.26437 type:complete len:286 (-) Transcript_17742:678-1535(-)
MKQPWPRSIRMNLTPTRKNHCRIKFIPILQHEQMSRFVNFVNFHTRRFASISRYRLTQLLHLQTARQIHPIMPAVQKRYTGHLQLRYAMHERITSVCTRLQNPIQYILPATRQHAISEQIFRQRSLFLWIFNCRQPSIHIALDQSSCPRFRQKANERARRRAHLPNRPHGTKHETVPQRQIGPLLFLLLFIYVRHTNGTYQNQFLHPLGVLLRIRHRQVATHAMSTEYHFLQTIRLAPRFDAFDEELFCGSYSILLGDKGRARGETPSQHIKCIDSAVMLSAQTG